MERQPILVVDDEPIVRDSIKDWLGEGGYDVTTAEDGEQAMEIIGRQEFGVVVLDLKLPGKDGIEVLKEAKERSPDLKAIIITAYPSTETAAEAMKAGAIDYITKPFAPDALERLIEEALGPAEAGITPEVVIEEKKAEVEKREKGIHDYLELGKSLLQSGNYTEALQEFQQVIAITPGDLEARVWIQKAKEALTAPKVEGAEEEAVAEEVGKPCVWMKMGMVSYRMCTRNYDCLTCEFDQMMREQMGGGEESPQVAEAIERLKALPGRLRLCRYALRGEVSYRLCSRLYQCATCEFGQLMEDIQEQKLTKLEARREALRRKAERTTA